MSILSFLGLATLQCSALMAVALITEKALRNKSAAVRHGLLVSFMALAAVCPLCTISLPALRVLPAKDKASAKSTSADPELAVPLQTASLERSDASFTTLTNQVAQPLTTGRNGNAEIRDKQDYSYSVESQAAGLRSDQTIADIGSWCVLIWALGATLMLLRILLSLLSLRTIRMLGQPDPRSESLAKRPDVRFLTSEIVATPLSFGVIKPCVVVPRSLVEGDIDNEQVKGILLHELAHIDRSDAIWQWVVLLTQSLHWFNPLVWIVCLKIEFEREVACDDLVVRAGIAPRKYAQALVEALPKSSAVTRQCLALSLSSTLQISARIRSILNGSKNRSGGNRSLLAIGAITTGIAIVGVSILRAREPLSILKAGALPEAPIANPQVQEQNGQVAPTPYRNADFAGAKLSRVAGREAFIQADFNRARLTNAILSGGDKGFQRASFAGADASGTLLLGGDRAFQNASFKNARLSGAVFSAGQAGFYQAIFDGAKLERATFRCSPTALVDMSVSGTNFDMADLSRVSPDVLRSWKFAAEEPPSYSSLTVFPAGFSALANGWHKLSASVEEENTMELVINDENNQAIPNARVFQNHVFKAAKPDGRPTRIKNCFYTTDEEGRTSITWHGESVDLRIWVHKEGFQSQHAMWAVDIQPGDHAIPAEFTMQLPQGTTIGGIVQDEQGKPVPGAFVEIKNLSVFGTFGATDRPVPNNWVAEGADAILTDDAGRWRTNNSPAGEVELQVRVSHAQFATNEGTGEDEHSLNVLRTESAITTLKSLNVTKERAF